MLFDPRLTFRDHIRTLISRAGVRHHVFTCLARSNWGLESSILRTTHNALLVSLTRYGLVAMGSGAYEADLRSLEVRHTNVAARRVLGVGATARLGTLFSTSDLLPARNLYLRSRAAMLDRDLRASECTLHSRLDKRPQGVYNERS